MPSENEYRRYLLSCTKAQLSHAYRRMGGRFKSTLRKAELAAELEAHVLQHPFEVLQLLDLTSLTLLKHLLDAAPGAVVDAPFSVDEPTLAEELLLVRYGNVLFTEFYVLPVELHALFQPHLEQVYRTPSENQKQEMLEGLEAMAQLIRDSEHPETAQSQLMFQLLLIGLMQHIDELSRKWERTDLTADEMQHDADSLQEEVDEVQSLYAEVSHLGGIPAEEYQQLMESFCELHEDMRERIKEKRKLNQTT